MTLQWSVKQWYMESEGVEIAVFENSPKEFNAIDSTMKADRTLVIQLTETHSRFLLESHFAGDVKHTSTFLDEEFLKNWGYGVDNCGKRNAYQAKRHNFSRR